MKVLSALRSYEAMGYTAFDFHHIDIYHNGSYTTFDSVAYQSSFLVLAKHQSTLSLISTDYRLSHWKQT